jgi:phosphoadenosine phosphosulfate reductase
MSNQVTLKVSQVEKSRVPVIASRDIELLNSKLEVQSPYKIIDWSVETFWPDIAMSSSFQMQSLPLLHIISQVAPQLPVIFLDTGYHFPETLVFRDWLVREWGLNLKTVKRANSQDEFVRRYGENLYRRDPDLCCYINKVEPMQQVMEGLRGWISGIRRDQSPMRVNTQIVEQTPQGVIRVHPMAIWTRRDIWHYIHKHNLPEHPLFTQGYLSIGCSPCTRPVYAEEDERNGRWDGRQKTECGLHTLLRGATIDDQGKIVVLRDEPRL